MKKLKIEVSYTIKLSKTIPLADFMKQGSKEFEAERKSLEMALINKIKEKAPKIPFKITTTIIDK